MKLSIASEKINLTYDLTRQSQWIIGRSPECDINLAGQNISRCHATLTLVGGTCLLIDGCETYKIRKYSKNGVFVNKIRISEKLIKPGDIIGIGPYYLKVLDDDESTDRLETTQS